MINLYWNQYISIEKEFAETVNYVALAEDNYRTYSDAYKNYATTWERGRYCPKIILSDIR